MASMESVKWDTKLGQKGAGLPRGWVFFCFRRQGQVLCSGYTPNLALRLAKLVRKAESDPNCAELAQAADILEWESHPEALPALLHYKTFSQQHPESLHQACQPCSDYVYLALDAWRFPFVCTQDFTADDWIYAGPWRSRFFLADVMDSVSRLLKLPYCESGAFPCEKLELGLCKGYCLALSEGDRDPDTPSLDKLDQLLREAYLHPDNGLLDMVAAERQRYFDALEFEKAELLQAEEDKLREYRDWLNFLYVTKSLHLETPELRVERGLLSWCRFQGHEHNFANPPRQFRDNERLALNLQDVDEARILYEYQLKIQTG